LSAWCEKGIVPPTSTNYKIEDGQVVVPATANERKGIQPVANLKVNGNKKAIAKKGANLTFTASVEVPENTGKIVGVEWDFDGSGAFSSKSVLSDLKNGSVKIIHQFKKAGTFFSTIRIISERNGNDKTPFARIQNLERVRVVVK
jgi:hypothetical protein